MPPTPKIEKKHTKYIKTNQNGFLKKSFIFKGFGQNGYQIRIQRKKLRISALVKIGLGYFLKNVKHRSL